MKLIALAMLLIAPLFFSPPAIADITGLSPFVGDWAGHARHLVIQPDGTGHFDVADMDKCSNPACGMADAPRDTVDFTLTSVSGDTATGYITARGLITEDSEVQNAPASGPIMATLLPVQYGPPGTMLHISTLQGMDFCNATSLGMCGA